jgi:hypothetical protein
MVNVYAHVDPHETVFITGSLDGLLRLRNQIDELLQSKYEVISQFYFDGSGEQYTLVVAVNPDLPMLYCFDYENPNEKSSSVNKVLTNYEVTQCN